MTESNSTQNDIAHLQKAVELSLYSIQSKKGGPFGCVIVNKDGQIIGQGHNQVTSTCDPSAHAQVVAIRNACKNIGSFQLQGCTIYTSCEPCPMCLGAIYWARPKRVVFANSRVDAQKIDFDDKMIYEQIGKQIHERKIEFNHIELNQAKEVFSKWVNMNPVKY